jgi:hypothetical protein
MTGITSWTLCTSNMPKPCMLTSILISESQSIVANELGCACILNLFDHPREYALLM